MHIDQRTKTLIIKSIKTCQNYLNIDIYGSNVEFIRKFKKNQTIFSKNYLNLK